MKILHGKTGGGGEAVVRGRAIASGRVVAKGKAIANGKGDGHGKAVVNGKGAVVTDDCEKFDEAKFARGDYEYGPDDCMLMSEPALAESWLSKEDREAWDSPKSK